MQVWFNGRTSAFQAEYVGSIPITCFRLRFMLSHFDIMKVLKDINARVAQLVEHDLAKVGVAGSSPVSRSLLLEAEMLENQAFPPFFLLKNGCIHLNTLEYTTFKPLYLLYSLICIMRDFINLSRLAI